MNEVPIVPKLNKNKIESKTDEIVRSIYPDAWKGVEPVPIDQLFEIDAPLLLQIKTDYADLTTSFGIDAHGYTELTKRISIVNAAVADDYSENGRRFYRATTGHELGHCF